MGRRNERTLDGITYRLHPNGGLDLSDAEGRRVELSPGVLFGLAVFLRWPGVRPLLTEAERERQRREGGVERGEVGGLHVAIC